MIDPDSVEFLPLTQGYVALVDADIYPELSKRKWSVQINGPRAYEVRSDGPLGKQKHIYLHHIVLPPKLGFTVDHRNSEAPFRVLDERRCNLRYATKLQQQYNRRSQAGSASRFKGVSKHRSRWAARIRMDGKVKSLGSFITQEEAAHAYDSAASKLHGEFARLNFPNGKERNGL